VGWVGRLVGAPLTRSPIDWHGGGLKWRIIGLATPNVEGGRWGDEKAGEAWTNSLSAPLSPPVEPMATALSAASKGTSVAATEFQMRTTSAKPIEPGQS
jgi:hypothetical protein